MNSVLSSGTADLNSLTGATRRSLRILEFIDTLDTGGAERMVACLSIRLQQTGNEVHTLCLRDFGMMPIAEERFTEAGVRLAKFDKTDGFSPRAAGKLIRFVRDNRIDVIHAHNPLVTHYAAAARVVLRTPILVSTIHGTSTLNMAGWAEKLFAASCTANHRIVLVAGQVEEVFQQRYPSLKDRTVVIPNGIEADELFSLPSRERGPEFVFGSIGRLAAVKDQKTLLTAFAEVRRKQPSCRLELVGCGELLEELESTAAALGVASAVTFHGWSRDIAHYLSTWDAFVLSSKSEGLPMTLLEAMAAGLPVAATAVGGIPEVIAGAECGFLAPPSDAASLAGAMSRLMGGEAREFGARARRAVAERYSVAAMANQYQRLFCGLKDSR